MTPFDALPFAALIAAGWSFIVLVGAFGTAVQARRAIMARRARIAAFWRTRDERNFR